MSIHTLPPALPQAFQIGLKPLDEAGWIDVDGELAAYLDDKRRLFGTAREQVFAAEPGTEAAQAELRDSLAANLIQHHGQIYRRDGDAIEILPAGERIQLADGPPLIAAARLVQEDLVLMRKGESGWRLAAAALCFPSSWRLADKFGRPMHEVHGPVPGFCQGTRNAGLIERMFDNLRPETGMIRWNWSLFGDPALHHPEPSHATSRFGERLEHVFFRLERQTLTKLPVSHDVVFTIRIYIDPVDALARHAEGRGIAASLAGQLQGLDSEQLDYKGLLADRDGLVARLQAVAKA
jgi:dimethylamine monooxygenase subunit A